MLPLVTEPGRSHSEPFFRNLGGEGGERTEQQNRLAVDHAGVEVRHRHRRRTHRSLAVDLGQVALDHVRVGGGEERTAHREAGVAFGLGDAGHLQQLQRAAAGADEDEPGLDAGFLVAIGQVGHGHGPGVVVVALEVADLMLQAQLEGVLGRQRAHQLASDLAEVDVGADRHARGGDLLPRLAAFHHQRHPLLDLLGVFRVLHAAEQRAVLQGGVALLEEGDVVVAPDEAHVRDVVDERLRIVQHLAVDLVGPELLGDLKVLVDRHRLADIHRAVRGLAGVVQFAERRVTGARVVPAVGAFFGDLVQALDHLDGPAWFQFVQIGTQGGAHDAATDQEHVDRFFRFDAVFGATQHADAQKHQ